MQTKHQIIAPVPFKYHLPRPFDILGRPALPTSQFLGLILATLVQYDRADQNTMRVLPFEYWEAEPVIFSLGPCVLEHELGS